MTPADDLGPGVELAFSHRGADAVAVPGVRCARLDELLVERDADAWVFVPLHEAGKAPRKPEKLDKARKAARGGLSSALLIDAELHDGEENTTPGVLAVGIGRAKGRAAAKDVGVDAFYWGALGSAMERHLVDVTDEDDDDGMLDMARAGLRDLVRAVGALGAEPSSVPAGSVAVACGIVALGALGGVLAWFFGDPTGGSGIAYAPSIVPALAVGLHLRFRINALVGGNDRELTREETGERWARVVPDVALAWIAAALAIALQVAGTLAYRDAFGAVAFVDETSSALFVTLWALPAVGYARSLEGAISALVQGMVWLLVTLFVLSMCLAVAGFVSNLLFGVLRAILPVEVPGGVVAVGRAAASIGAAVSFAAWMLGYTWAKSRRWFELWASDEFPSE